MTRAGREFRVIDARSGEDITRTVLTQIIMEQENGAQTMLPVPFLRQLIGMYGDKMGGMVPGMLEASMEALKKNGEQVKEAALSAVVGRRSRQSPARTWRCSTRRRKCSRRWWAWARSARQLVGGERGRRGCGGEGAGRK